MKDILREIQNDYNNTFYKFFYYFNKTVVRIMYNNNINVFILE